MPVYGAEATLERCIRSIQAQTLANWELLAIDDGSPDCSGEILNKMAASDARIKVKHQPNAGVAAARQAGLDLASGTYAIHVDPDDWVEPTMLEELVGEAQRSEAEVVICDYIQECRGVSSIVKQKPSALEADALARDLFQQLHGSCCNKLIKSTCYKIGRFIPGLNLSEDLLYVCEILASKPKIAYLPKAFYHYVKSESASLSTIYSSRQFYQLSIVYGLIEELFRTHKDLMRLIQKRKASYLGNVGALSPDVSARELRSALGKNWVSDILGSDTSIARKMLILSSALGLKSLTLMANKMRK